MYDDYVSHYKKYSALYGEKVAIFLQVGKFYEFYDILDPTTGEGQTTTKKLIDFLGIKLLYRKVPGDRDGIWAGVPIQSLHVFASRLTRENWTCVIFNESKNLMGKIIRTVARILSPGTHLENAEKETMYSASLWLEEAPWSSHKPPSFAASVVDLTTGECISYEGTAVGTAETWTADDLLHFFQVHPIHECVIFWKGDLLSSPGDMFLRGRLGLGSALLFVKPAPQFSELQQKGILERFFSPKLMPIYDFLFLRDRPRTISSLISLLLTIEDHFPSFSTKFSSHRIWSPSERVYLGNNVLTQVNFIGNESILDLFMKTHTQMGKRAMRQRLLYPISDVPALKKRLGEITTLAEADPTLRASLHQTLRKIYDLPRLHRKIQCYTITATDLLHLEESYTYALKLADLLEGTPLAINAKPYSDYFTVFKAHFDIEKASRADEDLSFLPAVKAPKTAAAEAKLAALKKEVTDMVAAIETWSGVAQGSLKVESRETLLYSITGTKKVLWAVKAAKGTAPYPGMTVSEKKSGANLNVPALDRIHTETVAGREELEEAHRQELPPICQSLCDYMDVWTSLENWIGFLDVTLTLQKVSAERGFFCPTLEEGEESRVTVAELRHPLIESQQTRTEYVKHSLQFDGNGLLLYGMNASGKSSIMKALGISVLLAQAGCYVPASTFRLVPFKAIFTRILNQDNLYAGLSSFAVEMTELREVLLRADANTLVLGDEVCSGTESVSATSLVASALEWLSEKKSCFLFATHLHGLLQIKAIQELKTLQIRHLRVRYDVAKGVLIYDRTIQEGSGSSLYGLEVARALQLPPAFLERAGIHRHTLLGSVTEENAAISSYNSQIRKRTCEVCGDAIVADLEVHHLQPQADAKNGKFADGTSKDHPRNLITVCENCHNKHHAKIIEIGPVKVTSEGETREIHVTQPTPQKSKWTSEQQGLIMKLLKEKPNISIQRLLFELEHTHSIKISASTLSKLRATAIF